MKRYVRMTTAYQAAFVILVVVAASTAVPAVEATLQQDAHNALTKYGISTKSIRVVVDGRDVMARGAVESLQQKSMLMAILSNCSGVRTVNIDAVTIERKQAKPFPTLNISHTDGVMRLRGVLANQAAIDQVAQSAALVADTIENGISVGNVPNVAWAQQTDRLFRAIANIESATVNASDKALRISGRTHSARAKQELHDALKQLWPKAMPRGQIMLMPTPSKEVLQQEVDALLKAAHSLPINAEGFTHPVAPGLLVELLNANKLERLVITGAQPEGVVAARKLAAQLKQKDRDIQVREINTGRDPGNNASVTLRIEK